jgi:hypothetical protein
MKQLIQGHRYRLPDGTPVTCTGIIYGVKSHPDHSVICCEMAHTVQVEPCGFTLESDDSHIVLTVNADGTISQRSILEPLYDDNGVGRGWRHGGWIPSALRLEDIRPVENEGN